MKALLAVVLLFTMVVFGCGSHVLIGDDPLGNGLPSADGGNPTPDGSGDVQSATPGWKETAVLSMDNAQEGANFGSVLARTDTRVVIGAPEEGTALGRNVGAVYIFEREGDRWLRGQRLQASKPATGARFGSTLAVHDDLIIVRSGRHSTGVVHVFARRDGFWTEISTLPTFSTNPCMGCSGLVLTADTLAVGNDASIALYARTAESFRYLRSVRAPSYLSRIAGSDSVIAGSTFEGNRSRAFAIMKTDGDWSEPIPISDGITEAYAVDGARVAVDGTRVAVGRATSGEPTAVWKVTLYELATGESTTLAEIVGSAQDRLSGSLSLRGNRLAVRSTILQEETGWTAENVIVNDPHLGLHSDGSAENLHDAALGSDDVFFAGRNAVVRMKLGDIDTQLSSLQLLTASETTSNPGMSSLGARIALGGGVAVVEGAYRFESPMQWPPTPSFDPHGTAYVFERHSGTWKFKQTLSGYGPCAVTPDGVTVACGAPSGGLEAFTRTADGIWQSVLKLREGERVKAIACDRDRLAVHTRASPPDTSKAVWMLAIYERGGSGWSLAHLSPVKLLMTTSDVRLAISSELIVLKLRDDFVQTLVRSPAGTWSDAGEVPAWSHDGHAISVDKFVVLDHGEMREFARDGGSWASTTHLTVDAARLAERAVEASFVINGAEASLAHDGNEWLAGSPKDGTGSVTLVTRSDVGFVIVTKWTNPRAVGSANFGYAVAANETTRLVGEPGGLTSLTSNLLSDSNETPGQVHVYERVAPPR